MARISGPREWSDKRARLDMAILRQRERAHLDMAILRQREKLARARDLLEWLEKVREGMNETDKRLKRMLKVMGDRKDA